MLSQSDIIYFIVTDRFYNGDSRRKVDVDIHNPEAYHGGDFSGIVKKIPYLKNLGITALWITPVYINTHLPEYGSYGYHGYWPLDFSHIDPHLYTPKRGIPTGSKQYLKELVDTLHHNGIKLILDMVVNHTGYNHPGLQNDPSTPIKSTWFHPDYLNTEQEGRMMGLPDLAQDNIEVADYLVNVITDWIEETGIDCVRMDTVKNVESMFWYNYKTYVKGKYPNISLLGEVLEYDIDHLSEFQKYFAFDSLFDFPLQKTLNDVILYDASCTELSSPWPGKGGDGLMDRDTHYSNHNRLVTLLDNHDLPKRFMTGALESSGGNKKLAQKKLHLALGLLMTARGIPQIYYGTEIGLEGGANPDNRRDMPWDVFGNQLEPTPAHNFEHQTFTYLKKLIALRKQNQALCFGSMTTLYSDQYLYVFLREYRGNTIIFAMNNGTEPMPQPMEIHLANNPNLPSRVVNKLANARLYNQIDENQPPLEVENGCFNLKLPGKTSVILKDEPIQWMS